MTWKELERLRAALGGRYTIERELGRGGMATVYLARDVKHDRPVALKVLHPELAAVLGAERFLREIRLTAQLQHPHILTLIDSGEADGFLYYVMPYVEGESLRQRLQREGQLPLDEALRTTRAIASALDFAHARGVIHRDIKPENIMLHQGEPMVADFGIALAVSSAGRERLTETGLSLGTPAYMSPEQASAEPRLDGRSDQYSLASVLYEMLAGEPPYTGPTAHAIIAKRVTEPIPHLGTVRQVPPTVEAAVTRALAKTPADRFPTVGSFVDVLNRSSTRATRPRRRPRAALALLITAGFVAAWGLSHGRGATGRASASDSERRSVAVLPFVNMSGDSANEYFSDGMTEELISTLSKVEGLRVAARTSAFAFKGKNADLGQVARLLDVATVLEGSVRRTSKRLRVAARLINASDGQQLWSDEYDRELQDVFAIQEDVARAITAALRLRLTGAESAAISRRPTTNLRAYNLYLLGRHHWNRFTPEGTQKSVEYFQQAIAEDSTFAPAYVGLANAYLHHASGFNRGEVRPKRAFPLAKLAAARAVELDSSNGEAWAALGFVHWLYEFDWAAAGAEYARAVQLSPNVAMVRGQYALYLDVLGRFDESIAENRVAQSLDPLAPILLVDQGSTFINARRYDAALPECRKALELDPAFSLGHRCLGRAHMLAGRYEEAVAEYRRAAELAPTFLRARSGLAQAYARGGNRPAAQRILDSLLALSRTRYVALDDIGYIYASLGERDHALDWLEKAVEEKEGLTVWVYTRPEMDALRSDPRFVRLLRRMRLGT